MNIVEEYLDKEKQVVIDVKKVHSEFDKYCYELSKNNEAKEEFIKYIIDRFNILAPGKKISTSSYGKNIKIDDEYLADGNPWKQLIGAQLQIIKPLLELFNIKEIANYEEKVETSLFHISHLGGQTNF